MYVKKNKRCNDKNWYLKIRVGYKAISFYFFFNLIKNVTKRKLNKKENILHSYPTKT